MTADLEKRLDAVEAELRELKSLLWPELEAARIRRLPPATEYGAAKAARDGHPRRSNPCIPGTWGWEMWFEQYDAEKAKMKAEADQ
jgi:hypothetical protein